MAYTFKLVSFRGDNFVQLLGVDGAGLIVGYHGADPFMNGANPNIGETMLPQYNINQFTPLMFPGAVQTQDSRSTMSARSRVSTRPGLRPPASSTASSTRTAPSRPRTTRRPAHSRSPTCSASTTRAPKSASTRTRPATSTPSRSSAARSRASPTVSAR